MILERVFSWIDRSPAWLQPAAWGAALLAAVVAVRELFLIPLMFSRPQLIVSAIAAIVMASAAGACGGLAYSLLGRRLLTIRWVGRYLTGIVCVAAYLLPLVLVLPLVLPSTRPGDVEAFNLHDPVARNIWLGCTLFFGILIGQMWFEAPSRHRPVRDPSAARRRSNER
jgi:hypothetical protein